MNKVIQSVLDLVLKHKYWDEIAAGTKRVEYREKKPYWEKRIAWRKPGCIVWFRRGYGGIIQRFVVTKICIETITHENFGNVPTEVYAIYFREVSDEN